MATDPGLYMTSAVLLFGGTLIAGLIFMSKSASLSFVFAVLAAIATGIGVAGGLQKLSYSILSADIRTHLWLAPSILSALVFVTVLIAVAQRLHADRASAGVALLLGTICVLLGGIPLQVYIGCQYGECINL